MLRTILLLLLTTVSMATFAQDDEQVWQAIEELKRRVDRLEAEAGIVGEQQKEAPAEKPAAKAPGKVFTRYWLSKNAEFDSKNEAPMREGLMSLDSVIKLNPRVYGYKGRRFFDDHDDPSLYPVAAVLIEGELLIKQTGTYQLIVTPTPPREVGGAGNVEVSIEVAVGDNTLITVPFSRSLASRQKNVRIKVGRQPLRIKIVARSPGFGPSPTRTQVYIGLQAEGDITPLPINSYLATDL